MHVEKKIKGNESNSQTNLLECAWVGMDGFLSSMTYTKPGGQVGL